MLAGFICVISLALSCDRPALTGNGVIGSFGGVGLASGLFNYPRAISVENNGAILVVDKAGRVQRFNPEGDFLFSWSMPETTKGKPVGLTVHNDGRIFVADTHYHRILVFDPEGKLVGQFGTNGDGDGEFQLPTDVAIDDDGFIYVSEYNGNDRITKWSPDFEFVKAFGESEVLGKRLNRPAALAIDRAGILWVADACNHRIVRFTLDGKVIDAIGHRGRGLDEFRYPYDIDIRDDGTVLVCEYGGDRLHWLSPEGKSIKSWGSSGRELGELSGPWGAAFGADNSVYVVDSMNSRVQIIRP